MKQIKVEDCDKAEEIIGALLRKKEQSKESDVKDN